MTKLIDKLAEESLSKDHTNAYSSDSHVTTARMEGSFRQGFEAGFRKAREMAANMCREDVLGGYGYRAAQDILMLGEEDVPG